MSILSLIVVLIVIGFAFWANNTYVSPGILRTIINVILIIIVLAIVLSLTGLLHSLDTRV